METLKGGHVFLDALPWVQLSLRKRLRVVFAGDGAERGNWERRAKSVRQNSNIEIEFVGWVDRARIDQLLDASDLMVIPSLWPEPFGMAGPEAGLRGVPAVAFAVGGIPAWLIDGINGYLAPADPPTASGLAAAIVRCLGNEETYASLRRGAVRIAGQFNMENHLTNLMEVFKSVVTRGLN
jgi:glycosyltransferase involved in cell wall biosynthesis